jgi:hypothetical protein
MINTYEEMIASLIHTISQNEIANLYNTQLLNLQKFSINIPKTALFNLLHDQYMVLYKLISTSAHKAYVNSLISLLLAQQKQENPTS